MRLTEGWTSPTPNSTIVAEYSDAALAENEVSNEDREQVPATVKDLRLQIVEIIENQETGSANS